MQIGGLPAPFAITLSPADDPRPFYEKVCAQQAQLVIFYPSFLPFLSPSPNIHIRFRNKQWKLGMITTI